MNEQKMKRLFDAARSEQTPMPSRGFESRVLRAIRAEQRAARPETVSLLDALGALFPRLAMAAGLVIGLCVAADFCLSAVGGPDLPDGIAAVSEQWLFAVN